jgi:hypothetical protein
MSVCFTNNCANSASFQTAKNQVISYCQAAKQQSTTSGAAAVISATSVGLPGVASVTVNLQPQPTGSNNVPVLTTTATSTKSAAAGLMGRVGFSLAGLAAVAVLFI